MSKTLKLFRATITSLILAPVSTSAEPIQEVPPTQNLPLLLNEEPLKGTISECTKYGDLRVVWAFRVTVNPNSLDEIKRDPETFDRNLTWLVTQFQSSLKERVGSTSARQLMTARNRLNEAEYAKIISQTYTDVRQSVEADYGQPLGIGFHLNIRQLKAGRNNGCARSI